MGGVRGKTVGESRKGKCRGAKRKKGGVCGGKWLDMGVEMGRGVGTAVKTSGGQRKEEQKGQKGGGWGCPESKRGQVGRKSRGWGKQDTVGSTEEKEGGGVQIIVMPGRGGVVAQVPCRMNIAKRKLPETSIAKATLGAFRSEEWAMCKHMRMGGKVLSEPIKKREWGKKKRPQGPDGGENMICYMPSAKTRVSIGKYRC